MTSEFDKILTDARGIKKTLGKLEEAEVNNNLYSLYTLRKTKKK
jgi:hypothetical protein